MQQLKLFLEFRNVLSLCGPGVQVSWSLELKWCWHPGVKTFSCAIYSKIMSDSKVGKNIVTDGKLLFNS